MHGELSSAFLVEVGWFAPPERESSGMKREGFGDEKEEEEKGGTEGETDRKFNSKNQD